MKNFTIDIFINNYRDIYSISPRFINTDYIIKFYQIFLLFLLHLFKNLILK